MFFATSRALFEESRGLAKPRTPKASDPWRDWTVVDDDGGGDDADGNRFNNIAACGIRMHLISA